MGVCSIVDLSGLLGHKLCHCGFYHKVQESLFSTSITFSPSFFTQLDVYRVACLSQLLLHSFFHPLLVMLSQGHCYHCCLTQLWSVVSLSWRQVELALSDMGEVSESLQKPTLQPLCYPTDTGAQNWMQHSKCGLTVAEQMAVITSCCLSSILCVMQLGIFVAKYKLQAFNGENSEWNLLCIYTCISIV